jgi:hypothetical protein
VLLLLLLCCMTWALLQIHTWHACLHEHTKTRPTRPLCKGRRDHTLLSGFCSA